MPSLREILTIPSLFKALAMAGVFFSPAFKSSGAAASIALRTSEDISFDLGQTNGAPGPDLSVSPIGFGYRLTLGFEC